MNIAIITAGGVGSRMKTETPKQFLLINDKPIIQYTIEAFEQCLEIDKICLVYLKGYRDFFLSLIKKNDFKKIKVLVEGSSTNQLSIYEGLKGLREIAKDDDIIVVHDGIRPLVDSNTITDSINVCKRHGNAVAVTPSNEAMLYSKDSSTSSKSIERSFVWKTQTPHTMRYKDMLSLLEETIARGTTNSVAICTMLIENNKKVYFSKGNNLNFKLTNPEDLLLFKGIINSKLK